MPITQGQMIEQMQEARAQHTALVQLRESLSAYLQSARERYPQNAELQEVVVTALYTIKSAPVPDDRATYVNERHYSRRAKWNIKAQADQERKRRILGIPEKREAMSILHTRNVVSRQLAVDNALASDPFTTGIGKSDQERAAEQLLAREPAVLMPTRTHSRPGLKLPRDDPDDPELEFETLEELALIANLPTGAVDAIVDPLGAATPLENNSQERVDNSAEQVQDSNGNSAKESGT